MRPRIAFAGTPEFAARALDALIGFDCDIPLVLTQPDRPAGRGMKLSASPVKQRAMAHGLTVAQPESLRTPELRAPLADAAPDLLVVVAYGLLLPQAVLDIPKLGCINIHASLLPRWRGAAPIQRAIQAGDARTGITLMQMDAGLDTGPMLAEAMVDILDTDSAALLHDKLASAGARLLVEHAARPARRPDHADAAAGSGRLLRQQDQQGGSTPRFQAVCCGTEPQHPRVRPLPGRRHDRGRHPGQAVACFGAARTPVYRDESAASTNTAS
jgi:methionyl-tRNA formyltransferase